MSPSPVPFAQGMAKLAAARNAKVSRELEKQKFAAVERHNGAILGRSKVDATYAINFCGRYEKIIQKYEAPAKSSLRTPSASPPNSAGPPITSLAKSSAVLKASLLPPAATCPSNLAKKLRKSATLYSSPTTIHTAAPKAIKKKGRMVKLRHNPRFGLLFARREVRAAFFKRLYAGGEYHPEVDVCRCQVCAHE